MSAVPNLEACQGPSKDTPAISGIAAAHEAKENGVGLEYDGIGVDHVIRRNAVDPEAGETEAEPDSEKICGVVVVDAMQADAGVEGIIGAFLVTGDDQWSGTLLNDGEQGREIDVDYLHVDVHRLRDRVLQDAGRW